MFRRTLRVRVKVGLWARAFNAAHCIADRAARSGFSLGLSTGAVEDFLTCSFSPGGSQASWFWVLGLEWFRLRAWGSGWRRGLLNKNTFGFCVNLVG